MVLEVRNMSKQYRKKNTKVEVLKNVSYKFEKGKFYWINGKSGAGKSTLIQILGLLLSPSEGKILIEDIDVGMLSDNERAKIRNQKIGFVFQSFYLNPLMKAYENVMLPMYINQNYSKEERKAETLRLLEMVGLKDRTKHFPKELSGGEQQRVAIARALANHPEIILADEPTGSLDPENEKKVLTFLKQLAKEGKCVIVVSHNPITKEYADKILLIEEHNIREEKSYEK